MNNYKIAIWNCDCPLDFSIWKRLLIQWGKGGKNANKWNHLEAGYTLIARLMQISIPLKSSRLSSGLS